MKKLTLALAAAGLMLFAASAGLACDKTAAKTADGTKHACCAKKDGKTCTKMAAKDGKTCSKMAKADKKTCPMAGKNATTVAMTGRILCEHCDLHTAKSCHSILKVDGQEALIELCPMGDVDGAKTAGDHGKNLLEIKGVMCEGADGAKEFRIDSYTVKPAQA